MQALAALHPPTYIHARMVSGLTECLCGHLLKRSPGRFVGALGCATIADVLERREALLQYARHAACCHDFGKIPIIDTIFMYGRALLDAEFDFIKAHSDLGYRMLSNVPSTRAYADVARGHHRFYNDKGAIRRSSSRPLPRSRPSSTSSAARIAWTRRQIPWDAAITRARRWTRCWRN